MDYFVHESPARRSTPNERSVSRSLEMGKPMTFVGDPAMVVTKRLARSCNE